MQNNIEKKLRNFKYYFYFNEILKGILLIAISFILITFFIILIDYFLFLKIGLRKIIFYSISLIGILSLVYFIIIPLLKLFNIIKGINEYKISELINIKFPQIKDRIINIIQLKNKSNENNELIKASILQKSDEIKDFNFKLAISRKSIFLIFKIFIFCFTVIVFLLIFNNKVITEPAKRIINYNKEFYEDYYQIIIENTDFEVIENTDYKLKVKIIGKIFPDKVYLINDNKEIELNKTANNKYETNINKLNKDFIFKLKTDDFETSEYKISVLKRPKLESILINAKYPKYISKKDEIFQNTLDLTIPEGTFLKWNIKGKNVNNIYLIENKIIEKSNNIDNSFVFNKLIKDNSSFYLTCENEKVKSIDTIKFLIQVVKDQYPRIEIEEIINKNEKIYKGYISDDYGLTKLIKIETLIRGNDTLKITKQIEIDKEKKECQFTEFDNLIDNEYDEKYIKFIVFDNDEVNGSKFTESKDFYLKNITKEEIALEEEKKKDELKSDLQKAKKMSSDINKKTEELKKDLLEKNNIDWKDKQKISDIIDKSTEIDKKINNLKNEYKEINKNTVTENQNILEKQDEINKLLENLDNQELKDLINQFQEALKNVNKDRISEYIEKIKLSNKDLEKELDRQLELLKKLDLEIKIEKSIDNLNKLAKDEENLKNSKEDNIEKNTYEQEKIEKNYESLEKDLEDIYKKNKDLEEPKNLSDIEKEKNEIKENLKDSKDNIKNNNKSKAKKSQEKTQKSMEDLANKLEKMNNESDNEQAAEDEENLRQILKNLVKTSFNQEDLLKALEKTQSNNPKFIEVIKEQKDINDDLKMIEDSLFELSKRQVEISSVINKEIAKINYNNGNTLNNLISRQANLAMNSQQFVITSINNLALLLSESLDNMQNQSNKSKSGKSSSSCKKPGNDGKPSLKKLRQMQEELNKQMQGLKKSGKDGKQERQTMSEQFAKMASQQEAIRQQMQKIADEIGKSDLQKKGELNKLTKQMDETEKDLVNKKLTEQTIKRQNEILTRMLESEKAEKQKEEEQRRESKEAKSIEKRNSNNFLEYNNIKNNEEDFLKSQQPSLHLFYKTKVKDYFFKLD